MKRLDWDENSPSGYPRNNPAWEAKARQVLAESKDKADAAEKFLRLMERMMRQDDL